ncbi:MAG: CsoS2 family carboxysome shell protein [Pseudomonadota bacterium]
MAEMTKQQITSGRAAALERRRALSTQGKASLGGAPSAQRMRAEASSSTAEAPPRVSGPMPASASVPNAAARASGRALSLARRATLSRKGKAGLATSERTRDETDVRAPEAARGGDCGCKGEKKADGASPCADRTKPSESSAPQVSNTPSSGGVVNKRSAMVNTLGAGRLLSQARRQALAKGGKTAQTALKNGGVSVAQLARQAQPDVSGRDLSRSVREERSRNGARGQRNSAPAGRTRPAPAASQDAPWKVGASETAAGQTVTGSIVGRSRSVTGDEPSTCRIITGTEYMGADIFRSFCKAEVDKPPFKVGKSPTSRGLSVTGTMVGRGERVTGDEPGTCKRVTGTEYVGADQGQVYCGTTSEPAPRKIGMSETRKGQSVTGNLVGRSGKVTGDETGAGRQTTGTQYMQSGDGSVPPKVGVTNTLRGGAVTGTMVGRGQRMTGDEPGSCRNITGDEYLGQEQFKTFCENVPAPQDAKVGVSRTFKGETITGTMTGRGGKVTGDEPGTCKTVTGTPYAGVEQYDAYCDVDAQAQSRARAQRMMPGSVMTSLQSDVKGKMTGDARGAYQSISGTPYGGADHAQGGGDLAAMPGSPDFPQSINGGASWKAFSVSTPARESQLIKRQQGAVTGTSYDQGNNITGPFGMGTGKVTGTEQFRFSGGAQGTSATPAPEKMEAVEQRSRVTGEGMSGASKITGNDWDRGDRVTGTEGRSATGRNPTRRGAVNTVMPAPQGVGRREKEKKESVEPQVSKVTGSAGSYDRGAMITVSGGARG